MDHGRLSWFAAIFVGFTVTAGETCRLARSLAIKSSSIAAYAPDDPVLFPERWSASELLRARLTVEAKWGETLDVEGAYEHRIRMTTKDAGVAGTGLLPSQADAPYRITQLDRNIGEEHDTYSHHHELDRFLAAWHPRWGEVVAGRQAIGLGRGVLFGAIDIFAPFSPLEVDREWRRGVDAIRVEARVSDTSSTEFIAAFGESRDGSAALGRFRGYRGDIDVDIIGGKRCEDAMFGGAISGTIWDAEMHVDGALFEVDETLPNDGLWGDDELVGKLVAGGSYTFNWGNGLTVIAEYHYNGFGVKDIDDASIMLQDATFRERFLRGDMQILGRQAVGVQASYPINDAWSANAMILGSPVDGSGVFSPTVRWDYSDRTSIIISVFTGWGDEPEMGQLHSEYGATSDSLFLQISAVY